ncbi:aldose epimerase family protein [Streptomyces sp. TRM 70361]|uniref:aldose epimerase family protein n=1 Tax=Streptomyces sp. TRM 70361 TaxID=3116553 RepID=UPI002E7BD4FE|nr:aldose epimerase family protein [Streptomyces sp. TRM 70361]MEE1939735.1 aldose epimerase family protein [Streptomyces sp. TRM 70361]
MSTSRRTVISAAAAAGLVAAALGPGAGAAHADGGGPGDPSPPRRKRFGELADGTEVDIWTLSAGGTRLKVLSYGGIVQSLEVPDRKGRYANISLGFGDLASYMAGSPFFGALIGRFGNRIADGAFTLDGQAYELPRNDNGHTLHGGDQGFDKRVWRVEPFTRGGASGLVLSRTSPDGEMGFPGTLQVRVEYTLGPDGEFRIDYEATTDRPTVVNLTNHTYFNLAGEGSGSVLDHTLELAASRFTPVGETLIPTGELAKVADTPFDFRRPKPLGLDIREAHGQIRYGRGYDHNLVFDKGITAEPEHVATVTEPVSGRVMRVATTEPGVQLYTGNFLDGTLTGTSGRIYRQSDGFCLETQHFPDSPNQPAFPTTVLRPGQTYRSTTVHSFAAE